MLRRLATLATSVATAIWFGGLLVLGAVAAPIVFAVVPAPANADAMTLVFRRFDLVATACGAVLVLVESLQAGYRALARAPAVGFHRLSLPLSVLALAAACLVAGVVSPRIAALHAAGVVRGVGSAGGELSRWHELAEWCGKTELVLLLAVMVLRVAIGAPKSE